jgi:hypothetical protein
MSAFSAEHLGAKTLDGRALLPGICRQARLPAGLLQKGSSIPSMLNWNLRKQQAPPAMPTDEQTIPADFYFFGLNWLRNTKNTELNFETSGFFLSHRRETIVFEGSGPRGFRGRAKDRIIWQNVANTSAQRFLQIK